jgi:glycogenin
MSPRLGSLNTLGYTNAWDTVLGIQKYADRLVKPPPPRSQSALEDKEDSKRRGRRAHASEYRWQDDAEDLSSRDGDIESEGEESGEEPISTRKPRRRTWRNNSTELDSGDDDNGEVKQQGRYSSDRVRDRTHTGRRSATPSTSLRDRAGYKHSGFSPRASPVISAEASPSSSPPLMEPKPTWGNGASPTILQSPIAYDQNPSTATASSAPVPEPGSSASASPHVPSSPSQPRKPARRVFDPARGVDVFKRGSEEVLARFLRMSPGSFDDSERGRTTPQPLPRSQN